ncbi:MAG: YtxH domain-containing protein [Anaerolineaceae bacterium]
MTDRDNGFGTFLIGFLVGGITGAVVSLLYAPQSGEQTRAVIKEKAIELRDKTAETFEETYRKAEDAASDAVEKAQELIRLAEKKATELTQRGQVAVEEPAPKSKPKKAE